MGETLPRLGSIGARVRFARERKGWSQNELGDRSGVGRDVIVKTENGFTKMSSKLPKVAETLGVPIAWILTGSQQADRWSTEAIELADAFDALDDAQKDAIRVIMQFMKPRSAEKTDAGPRGEE